jgi:hypothetical protein
MDDAVRGADDDGESLSVQVAEAPAAIVVEVSAYSSTLSR